ncbi:reverse transcriptase domain-containing protein [Tanacetum coccineum]|uniref:Reverse transcriptase domain-containing protein n=1 Tax=Tanacetum coccineum TaxID=301880 RepID=A0ABQ4Y7M7_9ASTR
MTSIMAPWPFYQWGIDILGPLPQASERIKYVIMAIDYFTKWIKAKPLVKITEDSASCQSEKHKRSNLVEDKGKLGPKWEGPYRVAEAYQNGSYKLQTMEDKEVLSIMIIMIINMKLILLDL